MNLLDQEQHNIRVVKGQQVDGCQNQTLIYLSSFAQAWNIFAKLMGDESAQNPLKYAQEQGLAISLNKHEYDNAATLKQRMDTCWKQITEGPSGDFISSVERVSHHLIETAVDIEPSMRPVHELKRTEEGPMWDAGLIASEDERPCFDRIQPTNVFRKGDGTAFRLIINTDTCHGHSDSENCLVTISLVRCLLYFGEVELWIQQGWVGSHPGSGVTLFPIHKGQEITPALTWFWLASSYRDSVFSRVVNLGLGRKNSYVSQAPQMEHDIYMANAIGGGSLPSVNLGSIDKTLKAGKELSKEDRDSMDKLAKWLADTIKKTVYTDEEIQKMESQNL